MKPQINRQICFYFLLLPFIFCLEATATIRYVSKTGSSTPPYTSWLTASDSIQKCINICQSGDTVYVANGVYKEKIVMIPGLSLIGSGMDSCIVDSRDLEVPSDLRTILITGSCFLKGFGINVSFANTGTGIIVQDADTQSVIQDNKINNARRGIWIINSNVSFKSNIITNVINGIRLEAFNENYFPVIDSNIIVTALTGEVTNGIQGSFGTSPTIRNNLIIGQAGGGGLHLILNPKEIRNNSFEKKVNSGLYGYYFSLGEGIIANNFITGSSSESAFWMFRGKNKVFNNNIMNSKMGYTQNADSVAFSNNNVWNIENPYTNFIPDSTNLIVDPMLLNEDSSDFHLQKYSPLIDTGNPSILDRDGSRSDIGLYGGPLGETYTYQDLSPKPPRNLSGIVDTNKIILRWNKNTEADTSYYKVYRDTVQNFILDSTKLVSSTTDTSFIQLVQPNVNMFFYKITCVDDQGNESNPSEELFIDPTSVNDYPIIINNYILYQNYPNPFNPSTVIGYKLKERGYVKLSVYDIRGELIKYLVNEEQETGYYETQLKFDETFASGVYLYKLDIKNQNQIPVFTELRKMVFIK
ncbi:MAG: T9SS type A sorting domain-containing protein [Ignavibacteriaceae bacterium]|nr:T9SS type A sorting domain-containing protein [Ignavibacteriaceae bacterium]